MSDFTTTTTFFGEIVADRYVFVDIHEAWACDFAELNYEWVSYLQTNRDVRVAGWE